MFRSYEIERGTFLFVASVIMLALSPLSFFFIVIGVICFVSGSIFWLIYLRDAQTKYRRSEEKHQRELILMTPNSVELDKAELLVTTIAGLDPDQTELLKGMGSVANILSTNIGPLAAFTTPGGNVPYALIDEFFSLSDAMYTCPVGHFSDSKYKRDAIKHLMSWLMKGGYILPWSGGNNSYRWRNERPGQNMMEEARKMIYGDRINFLQDAVLQEKMEGEIR